MKVVRTIVGLAALSYEKLEDLWEQKNHQQGTTRVNRYLKPKAPKPVLYQIPACFACSRIRRTLKSKNLSVEFKDASRFESYRNELVRGGGKLDVPCLNYIDEQGKTHWVYEPKAIIEKLQKLAA